MTAGARRVVRQTYGTPYWVRAMLLAFVFGVLSSAGVFALLAADFRDSLPAIWKFGLLMVVLTAAALALKSWWGAAWLDATGISARDHDMSHRITVQWRDVVSVEHDRTGYEPMLRIGDRVTDGVAVAAAIACRAPFVAGVRAFAPPDNPLRLHLERCAARGDGGVKDALEGLVAPVVVRLPLRRSLRHVPYTLLAVSLTIGGIAAVLGIERAMTGALVGGSLAAALHAFVAVVASALFAARVTTGRIWGRRIHRPPIPLSVPWRAILAVTPRRVLGTHYLEVESHFQTTWIPAWCERDPRFVAAVRRVAPDRNPLRAYLESVAPDRRDN